MTRDSMTEMLSETICVTTEEATAALEARDWDLLLAAQLLQQQKRAVNTARKREPVRGWFMGIIHSA